ncbi:MAG: asparagine synthase (glutamine-hydrolyzing) [Crocinitomicaceae bacterium]|nr:asparagine synthase (glutamine-hydrolyzing) [Crocinitomicaceae bacterium]
MCGIAGIVKFSGQIDRESIKRMTDVIAHRGPDKEGIWLNEDRNVGFGHRRLSIIDLSDMASQPMSYANDQLIITFNGEIYNYLELTKLLVAAGYTFKSASDTEVLLAMYHWKGADMLRFLDGMFAFAIWNKSTNKLFCARDRFGEKPFYYSLTKDGFYFASEMKALFSVGIKVEIRNNMISNYLFNDLVINPNSESETFYVNVKKLVKSTYLEINLNGDFKTKSYYKINTNQIKIGEEESLEKFYSLLNASVIKRMRSDVKIGSSLSGGLDSSILVYLIQQNLLNTNSSAPNTTFTARFNEAGFSENEYLECILNDLKMENHSVFPNANLIHEELNDVFYHQEEPFMSTSILNQWAVMRLANQNNVTVLLDGQGADEMLGGYSWHSKIYLKELYSKSQNEYRHEIKNRAMNGFTKEKIELLDWLKINFKLGVKIGTRLRHYAFKKWGFNALSTNSIWFGILNENFYDLEKVIFL